VKTKQNNPVGHINLMSHPTLRTINNKCMIIRKKNSSFELDAERVKRHNSSPGILDLIMHVTSALPIGLGSYNLGCDFQTRRKHYT